MFVKFKTAAKGRNVGDVVEYDDATAQGLIDLEIVEKTEAPQVVKDAMAESLKGLTETITKSVADGIAAATKQFATATQHKRGALEFADDAEIKVENFVVHGRLRHFGNDDRGKKAAYRFGMYCMGIAASDQRAPAEFASKSSFAVARCKALGIPLSWKQWNDEVNVKTTTEKANATAGYLVPDEFQTDLIQLREKYGTFRANTKIVPMASDVRTDPRRVSGLTGYFPDEATAPTYSDKNWDNVRLVAKKLMVVSKISSEVNEDAAISIGDDLAGEIAWCFANKEDDCGWNGTATSTYSGITGIVQALKNKSATPTSTIADVPGIWQSAATAWSTIVIKDFTTVLGRLPAYADGDDCKWYCHRTFFAQVMEGLMASGGGNTMETLANGYMRRRFLGYEVVFVQKLPSTYAANGMPCLFGRLDLASRMGDRRQTTIAMSDQFAFDQDAIVFRGTERFDIVCHDLGDAATAVQAARDAAMGQIAGPIVGLMTT